MADFIESFAGLLTALAALCTGLAALIHARRAFLKDRKDPQKTGDLRRPRPLTVLAFVFGLIAVGVSAFMLGSWMYPRVPELPRAAILSPSPGAAVASGVVVSGNAGAIPAGSRLWLVVHPMNGVGWWPQGEPVVPVPPSGTWQQKAFLGGPVGQRFQIALVLASADASLAFEQYLERAATTGDYPARPLPAGATPLASVDVVKAGP